ncbi:MAG: hypothetical protein ACRDBR_01710 [Metamycoplasmataceae bacterium]
MKKKSIGKIILLSSFVVVIPTTVLLTTSMSASENDQNLNPKQMITNIFPKWNFTQNEKIMYLSIASTSMFLVATISLVVIIVMKNKISKLRIDQIKTTEFKIVNDDKEEDKKEK